LQRGRSSPARVRRLYARPCTAHAEGLKPPLSPNSIARADGCCRGVGADRVLIASGAIDEETYVRALAEHLGVQFEPLDGMPRALCPLSDRDVVEKGPGGMLSLVDGGGAWTVVAPRRLAARHLSRMLRKYPGRAPQWRLTTTERLNHFILRSAGTALTRQAADALRRARPELSAARTGKIRRGWTLALFGAIAAPHSHRVSRSPPRSFCSVRCSWAGSPCDLPARRCRR
jgi:hypothetical protein